MSKNLDMNTEKEKSFENNPFEQITDIEESLLWSLTMHKDRQSDLEKAKKIGDQSLVEKISRTCEDYGRLINTLKNEFLTIMQNRPGISSIYQRKIKM
jgi:hypothetical protein